MLLQYMNQDGVQIILEHSQLTKVFSLRLLMNIKTKKKKIFSLEKL
nr:MAG TPA: hypothetical protein [Caudoviricetes sp.]